MPYGLRVYDRIGQLGTDFSDIIGLCHFAGTIPASSTTVLTDVPDRPMLVLVNFNGRLVLGSNAFGTSAITYSAGAKTLTIVSPLTFGADTMVLTW